MTYLIAPALYKRPGERIPPWTCLCPGLKKYQRHKSEPECIPQAEVDAWATRTGCSPRTARYLYWLEREFGARR